MLVALHKTVCPHANKQKPTAAPLLVAMRELLFAAVCRRPCQPYSDSPCRLTVGWSAASGTQNQLLRCRQMFLALCHTSGFQGTFEVASQRDDRLFVHLEPVILTFKFHRLYRKRWTFGFHMVLSFCRWRALVSTAQTRLSGSLTNLL